MLEDDLHALIGDIYEAAVDPDLIPVVLQCMCALTDSSAGALGWHSDGALEQDVAFGADPALGAVAREFHDQNLYVQRSHLVPVGTAALGAQLVSDDEIKRTDLYHLMLRPGALAHLLSFAFHREPSSLGEVSLWRPEDRERHGAGELAIANVLARHLRRSFAIACRVQQAWTRAIQLEEVLGRLAVGCLLIEASGRLIVANPEAEAILGRNRPLRVVGARVVADTAANRRKWQRLLGRLTPADGAAEGTAVTLETGDGAPLRVLAIPLRPTRCEAVGLTPPAPDLGLVVIGEARPRPDRGAAALARLYGLTAAEAGLAVALLQGESLQDYAERQRRSLNTVKTHLKSIFAKTGARRQTELIRELATLGLFMH